MKKMRSHHPPCPARIILPLLCLLLSPAHLHAEAAAEKEAKLPSELIAHSDADILAFVQKYKAQEIHSLTLAIDWTQCSSKGFAALRELTDLEQLVLQGDEPDFFPDKNGRLYFVPLDLPDSFIEQVVEMKSLKRIDVWYGCFFKDQKKRLRKSLRHCKIYENLNKI